MNAFALFLISVILFTSSNDVNSLELSGVEEGKCRTYPYAAINMTWVLNNALNMKYFGGGSTYNMYSIAALSNRFPSMREFEFYYNSCFERNVNSSSGMASIYGFGDYLGDFGVRPSDPVTDPTILNFFRTGKPKLTVRHQVTLTDYKSFIFFVNCWEESNKQAWSFLTFKPNADKETVKKVEAHASELGFQRKNFVFLRYETCPPPKKECN